MQKLYKTIVLLFLLPSWLIKRSHEEIMAHFYSHTGFVDRCISEFMADEQKRDDRVSALESVTATFNTLFDERKPQVEDSIHSVKLELTKLNTYFNRDAMDSSNMKSGVFNIESAHKRPMAGSAAAGPGGHRVDNYHQDCGFGKVYTQTHDPVTGTMIHSPHPPEFLAHIDFTPSHNSFRSTDNFGQNPRV
jgi:hypothetical protein